MKYVNGFGKRVKKSNLIRDKLGHYKVTSWIDKAESKPASIEYSIICKNCNKKMIMYGSPTIRRRTLGNNTLLSCIHCRMNVFKNNRRRIYDYMTDGNKLPSGIDIKVVKSIFEHATSDVMNGFGDAEI